MLKSLENLTENYVVIPLCYAMPGDCDKDKSHSVADEIQAEINKFYLPRPLFEDGEPADFGMPFLDCLNDPRKIYGMNWTEFGCQVNDYGDEGTWLEKGAHLKRPPKPDTQKAINVDASLDPFAYCDRFGLNVERDGAQDLEEAMTGMVAHLLERQRKLDGVE